jgi:type IV pilus assembly protein PilA
MRSVTCSKCGLVCWADADNCKRCGQALLPNLHPLNIPPPAHHEEQPRTQPQPAPQNFYAAPQPPQNFYAAPNVYNQPQTKKRTGYAIASLAFGIVGLLTFGLLLVGSVVGLIFGLVALKKESSNPARYGGKGLAIGGVTLNILAILTIIPLALIASIAIPNLLAARRAANEASAIYQLRRIMVAEASYQESVATGSYGTLNELVAARLIDEELSSGRKNGYRFVVHTTAQGYEATATPVSYGSTGMRSFYISSEEEDIHVGLNNGLPATANDLTLDAYQSSNPYDNSPAPARRTNQPLRGPVFIPAR